jgi:hypothetical protein
MDLLRTAFPEPLDLMNSVLDGDGALEVHESAHRITKFPPTFKDTDFEGIFDEPLDSDQSARSESGKRPEPKQLSKPVPHILAWYQPYHSYGPKRWGIYFRVEAMQNYCEDIYKSAKVFRSGITRSDVYNTVWRQVLRHEFEHCIQELVIAESICEGSLTASNLYRIPRSRLITEALATHFELTDFVTDEKIVGRSSSAWTTFTASRASMPQGYGDWDKLDIDNEDHHYAGRYQHPRPETASLDLRIRSNGKHKSKFISVPIYLVEGPSSFNPPYGVLARMYSLDCDKAFRALKKEKVRKQLHPGLTMNSGSKHDLKFTVEGKASRPIPLDCHAEDNLHRNFIHQLADLCDIPFEQVFKVIRTA